MSAGQLWDNIVSAHPGFSPAATGVGVLFEKDGRGTTNISIRGRGASVVQDLGNISNPDDAGQIGFDAASGHYVAFAWAPTGGQSASFVWDLYLADLTAGTLKVIARNPVDSHGNPLRSAWVQPVFNGSYLYWLQASPSVDNWGGSALMQYNLKNGVIRTLYRGLAEAFVPYKGTVLYNALVPNAPAPNAQSESTGHGPPTQIYAADAKSGRDLDPPTGISIPADNPNFVDTNGDLVLWATDQVIYAWRPSWGRSITLVPAGVSWPDGQKAGITGPTYPRIYKNFVVWSSSGGSYVLDLTTNSFARLVTGAGDDEMTGSWLALSYSKTSLRQAEANNGAQTEIETLFNIAHLPHLPGCRGS